MIKGFDITGDLWTEENYLPPIVLIEVELAGFLPGWYYYNDNQDLMGPFGSFNEAEEAREEDCGLF